MIIEGDWLHKLSENIGTAIAGAAAGVFGTLLSRASKAEVTAIGVRLEKMESEQSAQRVAFATVNAKLDSLHDDMRGIRRLLEKRRDTDE